MPGHPGPLGERGPSGPVGPTVGPEGQILPLSFLFNILFWLFCIWIGAAVTQAFLKKIKMWWTVKCGIIRGMTILTRMKIMVKFKQKRDTTKLEHAIYWKHCMMLRKHWLGQILHLYYQMFPSSKLDTKLPDTWCYAILFRHVFLEFRKFSADFVGKKSICPAHCSKVHPAQNAKYWLNVFIFLVHLDTGWD